MGVGNTTEGGKTGDRVGKCGILLAVDKMPPDRTSGFIVHQCKMSVSPAI